MLKLLTHAHLQLPPTTASPVLRYTTPAIHIPVVVAPRVSVDCAAGFIVAVLLGPGVKEVADLPRRVAGAATFFCFVLFYSIPINILDFSNDGCLSLYCVYLT